MAVLKLKRGTQAEVLAATLSSSEPAFATDTGELFVYNGTSKVIIGGCKAGLHANRPTFGISNKLYFETDTYELYRDTGSAWQLVATSLSAASLLEAIQDAIGGMVADNTETGMTAVYNDNTGKLNFEVTTVDGGLVS
jgi:hypothetical protein